MKNKQKRPGLAHILKKNLLIFHARYISDKYLNKNVVSLTQFDPVKPRDSRSNQTCPCSCTNKNVKNFRGSTSEWCRGNDGEASTFNVSYEPKKCMKNIIGSLSEADFVSPRDSRPISTPHSSLLNKVLGKHLLTEKLSKNKVSSLLGLVLGSRLTIPIAKPTKMKILKISPGKSILKNNSKARPLHPKKTRRTTRISVFRDAEHRRRVISQSLRRCPEVEENPGPRPEQDTRQAERPRSQVKVMSYNVRGLNDESKLRHLVNHCYKEVGGKDQDSVFCF